MTDALLETVANLSRYHREHEKFYAAAPLEEALSLQAISRTLKALAERWLVAEPVAHPAASPFAGAPDLNDERAIETLGVLFMEGEGEPTEIATIKRRLAEMADAHAQTGQWLGGAMEAAWSAAAALARYPALADLLGERHRIIAADWQNAATSSLVSHHLHRAGELLDIVEFTPQALREDRGDERRSPAYMFAASELLDHAADLLAESSVLVHENERRWRVFRERVAQITAE